MTESQLANLMSYTVFHIGVYISLFTALIGAEVLGKFDNYWIRVSVGCFVVAGFCGGLIASQIPEYANFNDFTNATLLNLMGWKFKYAQVTWVEHRSFWIGAAMIFLPFMIWGPKAFVKN